jgi:hypothetical protein
VFTLVAALRDQIEGLTEKQIAPEKPGQLPIYVSQKAWSFLVPGQDMNEHRFKSNRFLSEIFAQGVMPNPGQQDIINDRISHVSLAFRKGIKRIRGLVALDVAKYPDDSSKLKRINSLLDALMNKFLVLKVSTGKVSESLDIFLTLNNRGLPLGASDLVRGIIMSYLSQNEIDKEQSKIHRRVFDEWRTIADLVKEPEVFLRHYLVATGKEKVQKKRVFDAVQKRLKSEDVTLRKLKAEEFWSLLAQAAETYNKIIDPKMGGDLQFYLEMLEGLSRSHRILMLTVLQLVTDNAAERDEIARLTMVLAYRWVMDGGNAQMLETFFQDQSSALREGFSPSTVIEELKNKAALDLDVAGYLRQEGDSSFVSRALLFAVNKRLAPDANHIKLDKNIHLEHIAPQTEIEHWTKALFGDSLQSGDEYEQWTSEIGNLTLLDFKINIKIQQKPFEEKKLKYDESVMIVSRELKRLEKWGTSEISARTEWLAECFEKIWSIEKSKAGIDSFPVWYKANK